MQHVEEAGIHSGDSACVLPPHSLGAEMLEEIRQATRDLALALGVVGLINIQFGVYGDDLYVIEANPRASRTVPFVSQGDRPAAGQARLPGDARREARRRWACPRTPVGNHVSVKEAVLPFDRFSGADALLGPEMRSTGEVMGVAADFPTAFAKAQAAVGTRLPTAGTVFLTVTDADKAAVVGHRRAAARPRLPDRRHPRHARGDQARWASRSRRSTRSRTARRTCVDWIDRGDVDLVINTPTGTARALGRLRDPPRRGRPRASRASPRSRAGWRPRGRSARPASATRRWSRCSSCTRTEYTPDGRTSSLARRMVTRSRAESDRVRLRPARAGADQVAVEASP